MRKFLMGGAAVLLFVGVASADDNCFEALKKEPVLAIDCKAVALSETPVWKRVLSFGIASKVQLEPRKIHMKLNGGLKALQCFFDRNKDADKFIALDIATYCPDILATLESCTDGQTEKHGAYFKRGAQKAAPVVMLANEGFAAKSAFLGVLAAESNMSLDSASAWMNEYVETHKSAEK